MTTICVKSSDSNPAVEPLDEKFLSQFNGYYRRQNASATIYRLYNGICQSCGQRIHSVDDMDIGHIVPQSGAAFFRSMFSIIDIDNLVNLQAQHASCNRAQGNGFIRSALMTMNVLGCNERKLRQRILALAEISRFNHEDINKLAILVPVQLPEIQKITEELWSVPAAPVIKQIKQIFADAGWPEELDMMDDRHINLVVNMMVSGTKATCGYLRPDVDTVKRAFSDPEAFTEFYDDQALQVIFPAAPSEALFVFRKEVKQEIELTLAATKGFSLYCSVKAIRYIDDALSTGIGPDQGGCLALPFDEFGWLQFLYDILDLSDYSVCAQPEDIVAELKEVLRFSGSIGKEDISHYVDWKNYSALERLVRRFDKIFIFPEQRMTDLRDSFDRYFQREFQDALLEVECFRENLEAARPAQADLFKERTKAAE